MNKTYEAIKIFIATPSDLNDERNIFIDIITEVNTIKAKPMGYFLEPVGWEYTLPGVGRPQELINKELLECDLVITAFWNKWGSPTGRYTSGTEEEFYVALDSYNKINRPDIWLFFKDQQNEKGNDIDKVNEFKSKWINQKMVKFSTFSTSEEWMNTLRRNLCLWLDNKDKHVNPLDKSTTNEHEILYEISYQDWIGSRLKLKPEIYYTLQSKTSFDLWKKLSRKNKKEFIYNNISKHLGLILGAPLYNGVFRYKNDEGIYILLGTISRKYDDTLDMSDIYIPDGYNQICRPSDYETLFVGPYGRT